MITIAIPFYNAEKYLLDAIKSVFAQTFQEWELILIDDGSTDKSLQIAQSINDSRVRVISDGKNKRLAGRLNEVTHLAKYDYIARMDADDLMDPNRLKFQFDFLEAHPEFDLISTGMFSCSNNEKLLGYRGASFENPTFEDLLNKKVGILHASILARKTWYERNKYNEKLRLGQDTDMWLRASKNKDLKIKVVPHPFYVYREEGNVTSNKLLRAYKNEREYLSKYIDDKYFRRKYILKSYLKSVFVKIFGAPKALLSRRNTTVPNEYSNNFENIIKVINQTTL